MYNTIIKSFGQNKIGVTSHFSHLGCFTLLQSGEDFGIFVELEGLVVQPSV
jgi:hypothetical protein